MFKTIYHKAEDFFYKKILKPIIFTSRLGRRSMFGYGGSGLNIDYIYKNVPSGYTKFGKIIDKILLNLPAAKSTRTRKEKIIKVLREEIHKNNLQNKKTKIVDLASGPARYLVELYHSEKKKDNIEIVCIDNDIASIKLGKRLTTNLPILYRKGDVFKIHKYKKISERHCWKPNVVVVSGFYEFLDDNLVKESLLQIFEEMDYEGLLFLITQMNNPNKKLLEKLGTTRSKKAWTLIYRDPSTVIKWMEEVGYKDINFEIDFWKMFVYYKGRK